MESRGTVRLYRFGVFEADAVTGELRRRGVRVRLAAQPLQVLLMLLDQPGALLTRDEIARRLWPDGTFVDFEHGVNSAVNRIREALGDTAANPRFVETLARRGYRFVAPVETVFSEAMKRVEDEPVPTAESAAAPEGGSRLRGILATTEELPASSHVLVRNLFLAMQAMYLAFYLGLLFNIPETNDLLSTWPGTEIWLSVAVVSASVLIPARVFLLFALLFHAPEMRQKYRRLWPLLLVLDALWSLSPFLLLHHIPFGVALACTALLVYAPFAQRSLVLMGAADAPAASSPAM